MSRYFFKQAGIIYKSATCPLRSQVLRLTEASSLRSDSPRTSSRNYTVKLSTLQLIVASNPMARGVAVRNMTPHMMKPFMTQSLKISSILHSVVRALIWCIHIMSFRVFKGTVLVFGCSPSGLTERHPPRHLTVGQLLYSSDCTGPVGRHRRMQRQILIREYTPETITIVGFPTAHQLQHKLHIK